MNIIGSSFDHTEGLLESVEGEVTLVATLLSVTSRHLVPGLLDEVHGSDFSDPHLGLVWESAQQLARDSQRISKRTLLKTRDTPAIRARLDALAGEPVKDLAVREAVASVLEMSRRRELLNTLRVSAEYAANADTYSQALHFASERLGTLAEGSTPDEVRSFADAVSAWQEWIAEPPHVARTIRTPWPDLDEMLSGGLKPGRTYVIGGRPGEGKSVGLLNLVTHAAQNGHPGVVFSVEMSETEVVSRVIAAGAAADYGQITRRQLDDYTHTRIHNYVDQFRDMPLKLVDKADVTVAYIASTCRTLKRTQGLDIVVVDYLQLLKETDSKQVRERQVAEISRALKVLSRELDCAVIIACQLNRGPANQDRKPALPDLRESGAIEQDADVVILLHHEQMNGERTGMVELVLAKNRTGKLGGVLVEWRGYQARFTSPTRKTTFTE